MNSYIFPEKFGDEILKYVKENYLPTREKRFRLTPFSSRDIRSFTPLIRQLHENFTKGRRGTFGGYFRFSEARGAYLLGFYPLILGKLISLFKASKVLYHIKEGGELEVLDYAAGPLTATTALLLFNPKLAPRIKVTAVDIENKILNDGIRLLRKRFQEIKEIKLGSKIPYNKRFDLILVSHLVNEINNPERFLLNFLNLINENGIVIFNEPATRPASNILMNIREVVSKNKEW